MNNEQAKILSMSFPDVNGMTIGVVPIIPLKYLVEVPLVDQANARKEVTYAEDITQLDISNFYVDSQNE